MSAPGDPGERPEPAERAREVLDAAVRCLALGSGCVRQRMQTASALLLRGLTRNDLPDDQERERFDLIQLALIELELLDRGVGPRLQPGSEPDPAAEAIATQIADLRDAVTARTIREARRDATRRRGR